MPVLDTIPITPVRMVGMFTKEGRDHSSLRQGSNTKNQDHSWQSLPTVALSARLRYVRVRWWCLPSLKALVGVFGIISNGRRQFQRSTSRKSPHKLEQEVGRNERNRCTCTSAFRGTRPKEDWKGLPQKALSLYATGTKVQQPGRNCFSLIPA